MNIFSDVVDAADRLSAEEQAVLIDLLRHRLAERNRSVIVAEVAEAHREFHNEMVEPSSITSIMKEVLGES